MAATKRVRMARAMVTAMRVPVGEEGEGGTGHGVGEEGVFDLGRMANLRTRRQAR